MARADEYPAPSPGPNASGPASAASPFVVPRPLTALVSRAVLVNNLCALMREPDVALVTLLGVGGVGKTRVAIEVARRLRGAFRDGVYFVGLAPVVDADMVAATIARQVGAVNPPSADARERLLAFLAPRNVLLVLDNFEHLLDAAPLVSELLAACEAVTALVAMGNKEGQANALFSLAYAHFFAGAYAEAEERIRESLILSRDIGYPGGMATALVSYARLATVAGRPVRAARLSGVAEANREGRGCRRGVGRIGQPPVPVRGARRDG